MIGLGILALWDFVMTLGFLSILAGTSKVPFFWPWHLREPPFPVVSLYPLAVYGGYFALITIHLWTLRHLHRGNKDVQV